MPPMVSMPKEEAGVSEPGEALVLGLLTSRALLAAAAVAWLETSRW